MAITEELLREGLESGMWLAGAALATLGAVGALLTLGLTQPWGEVFPSWIPIWGGKQVPLALGVIPAMLISILITSAGVMFTRLAATGVFEEIIGPGNIPTYASELLWPLWGFARAAVGAVTVDDSDGGGISK